MNTTNGEGEQSGTVATRGSESAVQRLVTRFIAMAQAREDLALKKRMARDEGFPAIAGLESAALAYRRCAEEVQRVADGDMPPAPGERWD